jgi:PAS domain S-box-containing protein
MSASLESKLKSWNKFVYEGILDSSVSYDIAESWKRCRKLNVNHLEGTGKQIRPQLLEEIMEKNKVLLEIARPIMNNLLNIVLESHFTLVLTDRDGHILEAIGDDVVRDRANNIRFIRGSIWTEEAVGTNAIGTCLAVDKPIQIVGAEHYCISHHLWTCSAAAIHNVDGEVIGCINMSGNCNEVHSHTLGIVVAAAFSIEKQIELLHSYELVESMFESISDGIIVVDRDFNIKKMNQGALSILEIDKKEAEWLDFHSLFQELNLDTIEEYTKKKKGVYFTDFNLYFKNRRIPCSANIVPIVLNNEITGFSLVLKEIKYLHKTVNKVTGNVATYTFDSIFTKDKKMLELIRLGKRMANYKGCILIEGESGTGKELFAHAIHNQSKRSKEPFVAVNCASLPRDLIESELFGYEKGAFTGALKEGKPGKFELANGGTIFLDEIGELPLELQAKLLRVVENLKVRRIGGNYEKPLDIRIIAATNRNLREEVQKKNFREDLYFRLNVFKIHIPPLRDRPDDILMCAEAFLNRLNQEHPQHRKRYSEEFIQELKIYNWPGNVRELQNSIERAYYLSDEEIIKPKYLLNLNENLAVEEIDKKIDSVEMVSIDSAIKHNIELMLKRCNGNVSEAALRLNMSRASLYRRIKKYDIELDCIRKSIMKI